MKETRPKAVKKTRPGKNGGTLNDGATENSGRPPKLLRHVNDILKRKGFEPVKPSQMAEAFELVLNLDEANVVELVKDKEMPFFLRIIGKKLLSNKGDEMLERVIDRVSGRPRMSIDHTSGGEKITPKFEGVTLSELEKEFEARGLPKPNIDSIR